MFGRIINKFCPNCKKDVKVDISVGYFVDGKHYYTGCVCRTCKTDLSVEDRKVLQLARESGKDIGVAMY
jgi:hypothetical protein